MPLQGTRLVLTENSHILCSVRFTQDLSDAAVETSIIEASGGKIPPNVDTELMISVHSSLVTPTLAPSQFLDGIIPPQDFSIKTVFIRPSRRLRNTGNLI